MSPSPTNLRARWRAGVGTLAAALTLAGCGALSASSVVQGVPSASISVPLRVVACTTLDACVAMGTSENGVGPTTTAELRRTNGRWVALHVDPSPSSSVSASACWTTGCLIGGTGPAGSLLWLFDSSAGTLSPSATPTAGLAITAVGCFAARSCVAVDDTGVAGASRVSFTTDAGATWTVAQPMQWSSGRTITGVACSSAQDCLVAAADVEGGAVLEVTHDGGATWTNRTVDATWQTVSSLSCHARTCVGLVTTSSGSLIAHTTTFARQWTTTSTTKHPSAIACTTGGPCVVAGETSSGAAWLATTHDGTTTAATLRYVPTPITDVACGTKVCAAIGTSTVLSLRP